MRSAMRNRMRVIAITFMVLLASADALAQSAAVSLKPILKPGQEARYRLIGEVDTEITAAGAGGLSGTQSRELVATVLLRAGVAAPQLAAQSASATVATAGHGSPYTRETFASDASAAIGSSVSVVQMIFQLNGHLNTSALERA